MVQLVAGCVSSSILRVTSCWWICWAGPSTNRTQLTAHAAFHIAATAAVAAVTPVQDAAIIITPGLWVCLPGQELICQSYLQLLQQAFLMTSCGRSRLAERMLQSCWTLAALPRLDTERTSNLGKKCHSKGIKQPSVASHQEGAAA